MRRLTKDEQSRISIIYMEHPNQLNKLTASINLYLTIKMFYPTKPISIKRYHCDHFLRRLDNERE